jgi:transposase
MTLEDEVATLRAANAQLLADTATLQAEVTRLQTLVSALQEQLAALQAQKDMPPGIKPNKPRSDPAQKRPRKKRDPVHNHGRPRATPTEVRTHAYDSCPHCAYPLSGSSIARRREVLDLPPPPPVTVIEFQILKRYCPHCAEWVEPELNLDGFVVGHGRISVRIMALVAWLRTVLRLPVRQIQRYLASLHGLELSVGEICALLDTVAAEGEAAAGALKAELRASPQLYVDETGWRENGQNGYVWVMTNGAGVSYFHYDHSRAGEVARGMTGAHYSGTLNSDFYGGYNAYHCHQQRCWAHLLRDLAELEKAHSTEEAVTEWVAAVRKLYSEGVECDRRAPPPSTEERETKAAELRGRAHELGLKWAQEAGHPTQALGKRLLRHEGELFEFVRQAEVEATNNRAERAIRPLAVARKISGGTRSGGGSTTRMRLQTLFTSWAAKGVDPLQACLEMLRAKTPLPSS